MRGDRSNVALDAGERDADADWGTILSVDAVTEAFPTEDREAIGRRLDGEP